VVGKLFQPRTILHTKYPHTILKLILFELSSQDAQKYPNQWYTFIICLVFYTAKYFNLLVL
jgi:hypothetical protein